MTVADLTPTERRVLELIAIERMTDKEIGVRLGCSIHTVRSHVRSILLKLGVGSRQDAAEMFAPRVRTV